MNKKTYVLATAIALGIATTSSAYAETEDTPRVCPVVQPVTNTVYVDKVVTSVVTKNVPVEKIVYVEKPVYEADPVTSDMETIRAMMKVTHDRYLALLAKYRALKPRK